MASEVSESERSFVSAQSGNHSPQHRNNQSQHKSLSTPTPPLDDASDESSTSSDFQHQTPLARRYNPSDPISTSPLPHTESSPTSYFALQPGSAILEPRSPPSKRPPASRSSHGIETKSGPPPALSTQRSSNFDFPWRKLPSAEPAESQPSDPGASINSVLNSGNAPSEAGVKSRAARDMASNRRSLDAIASGRKDRALYDADQDPSIRTNGRHGQSSSLELRHTKQAEDLFLNLARSDPVKDVASDTLSRIESRKSHFGFNGMRAIRPSSSGHPTSNQGRPSTHGGTIAHGTTSPPSTSHLNRSTITPLASLRADLNRDRPYAASAHPLDHRKHRQPLRPDTKLLHSSPQQDTATQSLVSGRRRSIHTSQSRFDSSPSNYRPSSGKGDEVNLRSIPGAETESTLSTNAPSTVWDELDDLKARIRKIELTGNLPTTSNAAMSTVYRERPATATTTVTAHSTSPKHRQKANTSPEASTIPEYANSEHRPILDTALAKCKAKVNPSLYGYLDATVRDALSLVVVSGGNSQQGLHMSSSKASTIDRQIRRKAENMCRSLTELCLALAEDDSVEDDTIRPTHESSHVPSTNAFQPLNHQNPRNGDADLEASSRVLSRLEARRTSLRTGLNSASSSNPGSPQLEAPVSNKTISDQMSTPLRSAAITGRRDDDDTESRISQRPLSRARTDAGSHPGSPYARTPREYTSKHPLPSPPKGSPFESSPTPARKPYFPPSTTNSTVSNTNSPRWGKQDPVSQRPDNGRLAEARQRRLASLGYVASPTVSPSNMRISQVAVD